MSEEILLTKEGYDKIVAEHEDLVAVKRREVAERIKEALSYGDISENAEYDAAKNEQAELEERINKLENMMRMAKIIDEIEAESDAVSVGVKFVVEEQGADEETEFVIVGATEADPFEGRISNESLVGAALLGQKVGNVVEIAVPDGTVKYKIVSIG
jgi:transcription elongation factor GreA